MIDIHTHILPGTDDGSESEAESLEMLELAVQSGVDTVVVTPHCHPYRGFCNYASAELFVKLEALKQSVRRAGLPVKLVRGMEVLAVPDIVKLLTEKKVWTINDTSYFLTEFEFDEDPDFCSDILHDCCRAGFRPVVAHPERYFFVQSDPQIVYEWFKGGCEIQVNKGSLLGRSGRAEKKTAEMLLNHGVVSCVASDAHRSYSRTPYMGDLEEYLLKNFGREYTFMLTRENPSRILQGKKLVGYEPIPFE